MDNNNSTTSTRVDNKRWWDFYLVRYFMGTLMGSIVFYMIIHKFSHFSGGKTTILGLGYKDVFDAILNINSAVGIWIILSGGMLISYISSGPILILHTLRLGMRFGQIRKRSIKLNKSGAALLIIMGSFFALLTYQLINISPWVALINLIILIPFFLLLFLWSSNNNITNEKRLDELCYNLVEARKDNFEFVQTYSHLREHGNAFFIVVTEILFGGSIYFASYPTDVIIILSCWVIPPSFMWFFANFLEGYLILNKKE